MQEKNKENITIVELNDHEAKLFRDFQKYYSLIKKLEEAEISKMRSGNLVLNFNNSGKILNFHISERNFYINL